MQQYKQVHWVNYLPYIENHVSVIDRWMLYNGKDI